MKDRGGKEFNSVNLPIQPLCPSSHLTSHPTCALCFNQPDVRIMDKEALVLHFTALNMAVTEL